MHTVLLPEHYVFYARGKKARHEILILEEFRILGELESYELLLIAHKDHFMDQFQMFAEDPDWEMLEKFCCFVPNEKLYLERPQCDVQARSRRDDDTVRSILHVPLNSSHPCLVEFFLCFRLIQLDFDLSDGA